MSTPVTGAKERHPHLARDVRPGDVRVDMHLHSMFSGDSTTTIAELHRSIVESGVDVVCLTDHHAVKGVAPLAEGLMEFGHRVVMGEEVRSHSGEIIGLFINERISFGSTAVDTAKAIRDQGGLVYIPHPFDPMRHNLAEPALRDLAERGLIDAVEVINSKTSLQSLNKKALDFAVEYELAQGAGSDGHVPLAVGAAVAELSDFTDAKSFLQALHNGVTYGHHWDEPRPWTARIVPSV